MQPSLYVSLSGQLSLTRRLETLANNVANSHTAGFRAEEIKFEELISSKTQTPTSFVATGGTYISRAGGDLVKTDNALDIAVNGDAWLGIQTPSGTVYTRDGRLQITPQGELQTLNGYPILDVGGAPIQLNPAGETPTIARDGTVTQGQTQVGAVGLFTIPADANLTRSENSGVVPDRAAEPALDFARTSIVQGFVERANVNPILEISKLITLQRSFDAITNSINQTENTLGAAIQTLGDTNR